MRNRESRVPVDRLLVLALGQIRAPGALVRDAEVAVLGGGEGIVQHDQMPAAAERDPRGDGQRPAYADHGRRTISARDPAGFHRLRSSERAIQRSCAPPSCSR